MSATGQEYLVDRIIKDANAEAKQIVSEAKRISENNIAYAKVRASQMIEQIQDTINKQQAQAMEMQQHAMDTENRIELLKQQTKIVDDLFDDAFEHIKFNWHVEKHAGYEVRYTKDELKRLLRDDLEEKVVEVLFK